MDRQVQFASVLKSVRVKADPAHAFKIFTTFRWWPKTHSILASRSPQKLVVIEPKVGGRWFERGEDGSECEWGRVLVWDPPARLVFTWEISGDFVVDRNLATEVEVQFIPDGDNATLVKLEHRHFERAGPTAEKLRTSVDSPGGWSGVLDLFAADVAAA